MVYTEYQEKQITGNFETVRDKNTYDSLVFMKGLLGTLNFYIARFIKNNNDGVLLLDIDDKELKKIKMLDSERAEYLKKEREETRLIQSKTLDITLLQAILLPLGEYTQEHYSICDDDKEITFNKFQAKDKIQKYLTDLKNDKDFKKNYEEYYSILADNRISIDLINVIKDKYIQEQKTAIIERCKNKYIEKKLISYKKDKEQTIKETVIEIEQATQSMYGTTKYLFIDSPRIEKTFPFRFINQKKFFSSKAVRDLFEVRIKYALDWQYSFINELILSKLDGGIGLKTKAEVLTEEYVNLAILDVYNLAKEIGKPPVSISDKKLIQRIQNSLSKLENKADENTEFPIWHNGHIRQGMIEHFRVMGDETTAKVNLLNSNNNQKKYTTLFAEDNETVIGIKVEYSSETILFTNSRVNKYGNNTDKFFDLICEAFVNQNFNKKEQDRIYTIKIPLVELAEQKLGIPKEDLTDRDIQNLKRSFLESTKNLQSVVISYENNEEGRDFKGGNSNIIYNTYASGDSVTIKFNEQCPILYEGLSNSIINQLLPTQRYTLDKIGYAVYTKINENFNYERAINDLKTRGYTSIQMRSIYARVGVFNDYEVNKATRNKFKELIADKLEKALDDINNLLKKEKRNIHIEYEPYENRETFLDQYVLIKASEKTRDNYLIQKKNSKKS